MERTLYFLAHESRLALHSLETLLNGYKHLTCAGKFYSFADLLAALPLAGVKAVVINRHLPNAAKGAAEDEELAASIETLLLVQPDLRILIDAPTRTKSLNPVPLIASGAMAILGSDATKEEYYKAISNDDLHCNTWVKPGMQRDATRHLKMAPVEPLFNALEIEIFRLICEDKSNKEIAKIVCRSERTVEAYRQQLHDKTHTSSARAMVAVMLTKFAKYLKN